MTQRCSVLEIAEYLGGTLVGDGSHMITGLSTPEEAEAGDLVYAVSPKHVVAARTAGAALVPPDLEVPATLAAVRVSNPAEAMARMVDWWFPASRAFRGISPAAVIEPSAELGNDVAIGPLAYVGARVSIGDGTEVHPASTIAHDARIGAHCIIHSGVHIYPETILGDGVILHSGVVIGADGFGYEPEAMPSDTATPDEPYRHRKIRQVGRVVIADYVEIGANTTIDRATLTSTRIGRGTKIDNLVTIGHNAAIGRHCIIIGQVGVSGSAVLGDYVTVAGQAGLADHVHIGSHVVIGAQSGVTKNVAPGAVVLGSPAVDAKRAKKALTLIDSLPEFKRTLAAHERRLAEIERFAGATRGDE